MTEWIQIIIQLGFPTASLIFLAWKGIPWIQAMNQRHNKDIRELIDRHEKAVTLKDSKIEKMVQDSIENHQSSMRVIEANTRAIMSLSVDITGLKETNNDLKRQIKITENLTNEVKGLFTGFNASQNRKG